MAFHGDGDFQLGAHTVGARDQDGIFEAGGFWIKHRPKPAEPRGNTWAGRGFGVILNGFNQRIACIDVDTGVFVACPGNGSLLSVLRAGLKMPLW